jgi:hypothetical protein
LDLERRFLDHQQGVYSSFTKSGKDWELFFKIRGLDGNHSEKLKAYKVNEIEKKYREFTKIS